MTLAKTNHLTATSLAPGRAGCAGLWACLGLAALGLTGCAQEIAAGGAHTEPMPEQDPLESIDDAPELGSLDDLHRTIIEPRCSGQPGLCHNGQFEPNLSTPALTYANLVNRPSLEKATRLRVKPGDPDSSVFIDKVRGRNVATVMPLGADPLSEQEIAQIESWIADGALRSPGAKPAPILNNPPKPPQIAVFDDQGGRLDEFGPALVAVGSKLVIRHSVHDFETPDSDIALSALALSTADDRTVVLSPDNDEDPGIAATTYDPDGPEGVGDLLNYRFDFTIPATVELYDENSGTIETVPSAGLILSPVVLYLDEIPDGILAFDFSINRIAVE